MMKLEFVRYGGLSSVRQKGYNPSMPTFHTPPARRGIYAFVAETVEPFLISLDEFDSRRVEWVRDDAKRRILANSAAEQFHGNAYFNCKGKDGQFYLAHHKKPKYFTFEGEIWHHLPVPRPQVLQEKGEWVLTTTQAHKKVFRKELNKVRYACRHRHPTGFFDRFEVFIEKV